jgi:hypothetical protein
LRFKQNRPPRRRRESILEWQRTHAHDFQPKPEQSGKKCCDQTPNSQAEQTPLDLVQIAASKPTGRRKHNEIEAEDSRKEDRCGDVYRASDDELRREHRSPFALVSNERSGT